MKFMARCLVYSMIIAIATIIVIDIFTRNPEQILQVATFALLGEGGLMLVVGGAEASFSPTIGRVAEVIFRTEPWDAKRLREAEGTARVWIATGIFLFLFGLLTSTL